MHLEPKEAPSSSCTYVVRSARVSFVQISACLGVEYALRSEGRRYLAVHSRGSSRTLSGRSNNMQHALRNSHHAELVSPMLVCFKSPT